MIHGILNVYKEQGYTSHDVVAKLRGITKQKKIGHTGTLDPDAEGVLPICLGSATKICSLLTDRSKNIQDGAASWADDRYTGCFRQLSGESICQSFDRKSSERSNPEI